MSVISRRPLSSWEVIRCWRTFCYICVWSTIEFYRQYSFTCNRNTPSSPLDEFVGVVRYSPRESTFLIVVTGRVTWSVLEYLGVLSGVTKFRGRPRTQIESIEPRIVDVGSPASENNESTMYDREVSKARCVLNGTGEGVVSVRWRQPYSPEANHGPESSLVFVTISLRLRKEENWH